MEEVLCQKLEKYNKTVENKYRQQWGSTLLYLGGEQRVNGQKLDEV